MMRPRYLEDPISDDLPSKRVFLAGPRQVGKTTLARRVLDRFGAGLCLTWDRREDLEASHRAMSHWMEVLERLYFLFRLRPFAYHAVRSLRKRSRRRSRAETCRRRSTTTGPASGFRGSTTVVLDSTRDFVEDGVRCLPAHVFLGALV